jgi:hypothetical protein
MGAESINITNTIFHGNKIGQVPLWWRVCQLEALENACCMFMCLVLCNDAVVGSDRMASSGRNTCESTKVTIYISERVQSAAKNYPSISLRGQTKTTKTSGL